MLGGTRTPNLLIRRKQFVVRGGLSRAPEVLLSRETTPAWMRRVLLRPSDRVYPVSKPLSKAKPDRKPPPPSSWRVPSRPSGPVSGATCLVDGAPRLRRIEPADPSAVSRRALTRASATPRHGYGSSLVKGSRFQSLHRSRNAIPARRAMRSSSDGHTLRNGAEKVLVSPSTNQ